MADPLTDERLADIASTHDLCDPDDGPRCEVAELLAEVLRLRGDLLRLADKDPDLRTVYAYELGHNEAVRQIGADRDRYTAVIDQVRALHRQAQPDKGFCEYCDETWPCPTAALLPPATQPADGTGHVHGWEIICVDGIPTHGQCRGCPATQNLETGEIRHNRQEGTPE